MRDKQYFYLISVPLVKINGKKQKMTTNEILSKINNTAIADNIKATK